MLTSILAPETAFKIPVGINDRIWPKNRNFARRQGIKSGGIEQSL